MRVLVTRAAEDAERTAARLQAKGHKPVIAPLMEIVATDAAPPEAPWDALILTSAHAVPMLAPVVSRERPVFAVGERTAAAARGAGLSDVRAGGGEARRLAGFVAGTLPVSSTLLHATTAHRNSEPEASLRMAGFRLLVWECYEARAVTALPRVAVEALRTRQLDAVLHFSRRSADLLVRLAVQEGLGPLLRDIAHLCISADAATPLAGVGAAAMAAPEPTEDALIALLSGPSR